jgi:hypothetical protein
LNRIPQTAVHAPERRAFLPIPRGYSSREMRPELTNTSRAASPPPRPREPAAKQPAQASGAGAPPRRRLWQGSGRPSLVTSSYGRHRLAFRHRLRARHRPWRTRPVYARRGDRPHAAGVWVPAVSSQNSKLFKLTREMCNRAVVEIFIAENERRREPRRRCGTPRTAAATLSPFLRLRGLHRRPGPGRRRRQRWKIHRRVTLVST